MAKRICVIGLGLIGGSLALSLKKDLSPVKITGTSGHLLTVKKALKKKAIDRGTMDMTDAVSDADIVFICTPIPLIIPTLKKIARHLRPDTIVTDVGSTKADIVSKAEKIMPKGRHFIGGHPMAGTEHFGFDSAFAGLFKGRPYILTPTSRTSRTALSLLRSIISKLGARPIILSAREQDRLVAGISHLPLAVASALTMAIAGQKDNGKFASVASSGFRDTTRVASGTPELGIGLFMTNREQVLAMIKQFKRSLASLERAISRGDAPAISAFLSSAKKFRDKVFG